MLPLRHIDLRFLKGYSCSFSSQIKPHYCNNIRHFMRLTLSKLLIQYLKLGDLFASSILKLNIDVIYSENWPLWIAELLALRGKKKKCIWKSNARNDMKKHCTLPSKEKKTPLNLMLKYIFSCSKIYSRTLLSTFVSGKKDKKSSRNDKEINYKMIVCFLSAS